MKRIQLFEFEDFKWFPSWIRTSMTNLIAVLHKMLGTQEVLVNLLTDIRQKCNFSKIVDLGSGSGGIMPDVVAQLNNNTSESISLLLTDLYPNPKLVNHINGENNGYLSYSIKPLNATDLTSAPQGLKTMINSFHHMPPNKAKATLSSAQKHEQPVLIYEIAENKLPLLWWLLLPISLVILFVMALLMTPFCKPLSLKQLIFTYIIPIIPIFYAWDGQASLPRMYTFNDINILLKDLPKEQYQWTMDVVKKPNGKALGYYILGLPTS